MDNVSDTCSSKKLLWSPFRACICTARLIPLASCRSACICFVRSSGCTESLFPHLSCFTHVFCFMDSSAAQQYEHMMTELQRLFAQYHTLKSLPCYLLFAKYDQLQPSNEITASATFSPAQPFVSFPSFLSHFPLQRCLHWSAGMIQHHCYPLSLLRTDSIDTLWNVVLKQPAARRRNSLSLNNAAAITNAVQTAFVQSASHAMFTKTAAYHHYQRRCLLSFHPPTSPSRCLATLHRL